MARERRCNAARMDSIGMQACRHRLTGISSYIRCMQCPAQATALGLGFPDQNILASCKVECCSLESPSNQNVLPDSGTYRDYSWQYQDCIAWIPCLALKCCLVPCLVTLSRQHLVMHSHA